MDRTKLSNRSIPSYHIPKQGHNYKDFKYIGRYGRSSFISESIGKKEYVV